MLQVINISIERQKRFSLTVFQISNWESISTIHVDGNDGTTNLKGKQLNNPGPQGPDDVLHICLLVAPVSCTLPLAVPLPLAFAFHAHIASDVQVVEVAKGGGGYHEREGLGKGHRRQGLPVPMVHVIVLRVLW